ncbi:MAG: hypothetical protein QXH67_00500 [Candidatus Bathyarchaeia archaeon]
MSGKSIFERLQFIDRRIIYWTLLILIMLPFIRPFGLPVTITKQSVDVFNEVKSVKEGEVVLIDLFITPATWSELLGGTSAIIKTFINQKVKMVFVSPLVDIGVTWDRINALVPELKQLKYGEDYVFLGFYAGGEAAAAEMAKDIRRVFPADYYGTPTEKIPLIMKANKAEDFRLMVGTGEQIEKFIYHWSIPHGTTIVMMAHSMAGSTLMPYYLSGNLKGLAVGVRGGAELEKLTGFLGDATIRMDAINITHILFVALIILANVGYTITRTRLRRM